MDRRSTRGRTNGRTTDAQVRVGHRGARRHRGRGVHLVGVPVINGEPSAPAASGIGFAVVMILALSACLGAGIGIAVSSGRARVPVATVFAILAMSAAGYALWAWS